MRVELKVCVKAVQVTVHPYKEMAFLLQMRPEGSNQSKYLLALSLLLFKACYVWAIDVPHTESLTHKTLV